MNSKCIDDFLKELSFSYQTPKAEVKQIYFFHLALELRHNTFGDQEYYQRISLKRTEDDLRLRNRYSELFK